MTVKLLNHVWLFVTPRTVCSLPGSSIHEILQARILEWVAISFYMGSSDPGIKTRSPTAGRFFTIWATRGSYIDIKYHLKILLTDVYKVTTYHFAPHASSINIFGR